MFSRNTEIQELYTVVGFAMQYLYLGNSVHSRSVDIGFDQKSLVGPTTFTVRSICYSSLTRWMPKSKNVLTSFIPTSFCYFYIAAE